MTERKHTELLWIGRYGVVRGDQSNELVAECGGATQARRANAEFIALSANNHYALIEALEELTDALENNIHVSAQEHELEQLAYANGKALATLKQAKGESE